MEVYKNFEEKEKFFSNRELIITKEQFDEFYFKLNNGNSSIWRGMNEAKFKLYNSMQRFWFDNDLNRDKESVIQYLKSIVEYAGSWNKTFLDKYFNNYGYEFRPSTFTILSTLQHFGTPTPMLDFTRNPKVALYFSSKYCINKCSKETINNYFSIYQIEKNHYLQNFNPKTILLKEVENNSKTLEKAQEEICSMKFFNVNLNSKQKYLLLKLEDKQNDQLKFLINTNYNIVNQEGLFIFHLDSQLPLEDVFICFVKELCKESLGKTEFTNDPIIKKPEELISILPKIGCINIHKSLKEYCLDKLEKDGITESFLFPDLKKLAEECTINYLKNK
jgi:hypothetical protein